MRLLTDNDIAKDDVTTGRSIFSGFIINKNKTGIDATKMASRRERLVRARKYSEDTSHSEDSDRFAGEEDRRHFSILPCLIVVCSVAALVVVAVVICAVLVCRALPKQIDETDPSSTFVLSSTAHPRRPGTGGVTASPAPAPSAKPINMSHTEVVALDLKQMARALLLNLALTRDVGPGERLLSKETFLFAGLEEKARVGAV